jgi:chromate reductase
MRVLGISGSLRRESHNARLLRAAALGLPPGARLELFGGLGDLPPFNEDAEHAPGREVERWLDAIADADAVLFATPEYNAGVPGALKNAVDWASRPYPDNVLRDKPVAVIGASTDLRKSVRYAGARVLDDELPVPLAADAFDAGGRLRDPDLSERLHDLVSALVREVEAPVEVA